MKVRIPEFLGFRLDDRYPVPVKVFASVAEPTYPTEARLTELMGANAERTKEIKQEFFEYLKDLEEYYQEKLTTKFDEEDWMDEVLTNDELFTKTDTTRFIERTNSRRWTARDQIDYDYEGRLDD